MTTEITGPETATVATGAETETGTASTSTASATTPAPKQAGQAEPATGSATEAPAPAAAKQDVPEFFDPKSIKGKPELEAAYRQMQKAYTQKTQALAEQRRKVEAYDQFVANPDGVVQYLTSQGYQVHRPGQQPQAAPQAAGGSPDSRPFEPQTWDDVFSEVERRMISRVQEQMAPVVQNIRETTAKNIERQLEEIDPNWRLYEDDMKETLRAHPTLVKDVGRLYRLSVPEDVQRDRMVKEALARHTQKVESAKVHGSGTTAKTAPAPRKVSSFQDAVEVAKEALRAGQR